jgi:D-alanine--poly(phosphoribitol) ligase subunit 2
MTKPRDVEIQLLAFLKREVFSPQIPISEDTDLIAAGFDSLSLVRLLLFVEQTYGLWIPESNITTEILHDVRSLAAAVCGLLHER